jgi:glutamine synthetase adenylyltransferase
VTSPSPRKPGSDLAAGVAAALAFLVMVLVLKMALWLGALLAAAVYAGVWLLYGAPAALPRREATEDELIHRIAQLYQPVENPRVREQVGRICEQARRVSAFLKEHPERIDPWRDILRECLQSTLRILERYVELARYLDDPGTESLRQVEELLGEVSQAFVNIRHRLIDEGAHDLSGEMQVFRSTLQALDEINVVNRGGGSA